MKILIVQLARLGDIYMSWPIARALKRKDPDSTVHFFVREKFQRALVGLEVNERTHLLKTKEIIGYGLENREEPTEYLEQQLSRIRNENYNLIINLSFSPVSSYICYYLSYTIPQVADFTFTRSSLTRPTIVGYTRNVDSSFCLKEAVSAYYYSQVGTEKYNRFHLIDIFASLCDLDLKPQDYKYPSEFSLNSPIDGKYITIQLGASQKNKTLTPFIWARVIKKLLSYRLGYKIVLLGSKEEEELVDEVFAFNNYSEIINLIGKTNLDELFPILKGSSLHVGGDSVFIHMCNLTQTPCLNFSFETVKFWETGPKSNGSFVLLNILPANVESTEAAAAIHSVLTKNPLPQLISYVPEVPCYSLKFDLVNDFEWALVKALYIGDPFPVTDDIHFHTAMVKLHHANNTIINTLNSCLAEGTGKYLKILEAEDEVFKGIARLSSKAGIYIDWCLAEKIKVPPLTENKIVESYLRVHNELKLVMKPYLLEEELTQEEEKNHG